MATETEHEDNARRLGRNVARLSTGTIEQLERIHRRRAAREGYDWRLGWPAAVDAFHDERETA